MNNEGILTTNKQGNLNNYGNVWYYPKSISNLLILSNVKKKNIIIYESDKRDIFIVINTRPGVNDMIFTANKDKIHYKYVSNTKIVYMLSTMEEN